MRAQPLRCSAAHRRRPLAAARSPSPLAAASCGLLHVFLQHTSASLVLNENADPDVRADFESWARLAVPEGREAPWQHTDEGDDDMPAHIKAAVIGGPSLTLPVSDGRCALRCGLWKRVAPLKARHRLALGTWQGIWLAEHRDKGGWRRLVLTLQGVE